MNKEIALEKASFVQLCKIWYNIYSFSFENKIIGGTNMKSWKKYSIIATVALLLVYSVVVSTIAFGGGNSGNNANPTISTTPTAAPIQLNLNTLQPVPTGTNDEKMAEYFAVCKTELTQDEMTYINFKTKYTIGWLEKDCPLLKSGDGNLYFPVLYRTADDKIQIWGLTYKGDLYTGENCFTNAHLCGQPAPGVRIMADYAGAIYYDEASGSVESWAYGVHQQTYKLPAKSIYTGHSYWEGYIFRSGNEVYALHVNTPNYSDGVTKIASGVKQVVVCDYYLTSDPWSQPLFLMEDGTLQAYVGWNNPGDPESLENLVNIYYEGGYPLVYLPSFHND